MRRIALFVILLGSATLMFAQQGIQNKALRKECKKTIKLMKKGGWEVYASPSSMADAVTRYYAELEAGGNEVCLIIGHGRGKSSNLAHTMAKSMALKETAGMRESEVSSGTSVVMQNLNEGKEVKSGIHFDQQVQVKVQQTLKGMRPSLQVFRKHVDGKKQETTEVQVFYLVKN